MNEGTHILLVEDEKALADTLLLNLRITGYEVFLARTGQEALDLFQKHHRSLHLVLLDIMLPDITGHELCQQFKSKLPNLPVVFLTARDQISDKITGLKLGADDYITKPFDLEELLLRIHNLLKRSVRAALPIYQFANGEINFSTFEIRDRLGSLQTVSKREIGLLEVLTTNANQVISRDLIIEKLWSEDENASSRTIDNYILNFRKYFEENPREPKHFQSIRGVGYKFVP